MVFKNELYPIHFYGRVRGKCDGRLQNWPGIANERPKFLAMYIMRVVRYLFSDAAPGQSSHTILQCMEIIHIDLHEIH